MNIEFTENITLDIAPSEIEKLIRSALAAKGYQSGIIKFNVQAFDEDDWTFLGATAYDCKKVE